MSLPHNKLRILEELWKASVPIRPKKLSERMGFSFPALMMHLIGLKRLGYVRSENGYYSITNDGRKALNFPVLNFNLAKKLLSPVPKEKAFYFFKGIGNYLGVYATSLEDFYEKIKLVDAESIEFHLERCDFTIWLEGLGDIELAKKIRFLKDGNKKGEELRNLTVEIVKQRIEELKRFVT